MPRRRNKIRQKHVPDVVFSVTAVGGGTVSWYHFAVMVSRVHVCFGVEVVIQRQEKEQK